MRIGLRAGISVGATALLGALLTFTGSSAALPASLLPAHLASVTLEAQNTGGVGYWLVNAAGGVSALGGAKFYGSMEGRHLAAPIVGIVATADGRGYWLVAADGGVFSFGDARFAGSLSGTMLAAPIVGMAVSRAETSPTAGARGVEGPTGPRGRTGGAGTPGSNGTDGARGPAGGTGLQGPAGGTGSPGPAGGTGPQGPAGGTGPQGPAGAPDYAYVYNSGAQVVALEAAVTFDTNGPLLGFTHAPGTAEVTATATGAYRMSFSVSGVEAGQFALMVNGVAAPGTTYGAGSGISQNDGQAILDLAAGDVITLVNHTSAASVTLQTLAGGTRTNVNASLAIEQLG